MSEKLDIKGIIFDLDGTLLNTLEDIATAENKALAELGFPTIPIDEYRWIVGGGAENIAQRLLPQTMQDEKSIRNFVDRFRHFYHQNWHDKTCPYPGIKELITALQQKKIKMAIISNKPEEFALKIADYYFPDWQGKEQPALFTHVLGHNKVLPAKPDPTTAKAIAGHWKLLVHQIGFIGDSDIDILTAINAGMVPIGAEWGFRGSEELNASGAKLLLKQPIDLLNYLR